MPDGSVYVGLRERKAGHEGCHVTNQLSQVAFHLEAKSTMLAFTPIDFFSSRDQPAGIKDIFLIRIWWLK